MTLCFLDQPEEPRKAEKNLFLPDNWLYWNIRGYIDKDNSIQEIFLGNALEVQWLGLHTSTAREAWVWFLVRELRSHKLCSMAQQKTNKKARKYF